MNYDQVNREKEEQLSLIFKGKSLEKYKKIYNSLIVPERVIQFKIVWDP